MKHKPQKKAALVPARTSSANSMMAGRPTDVKYQIIRRAYELYSARGGEAGHEVDDWLKAEKEIMYADVRQR